MSLMWNDKETKHVVATCAFQDLTASTSRTGLLCVCANIPKGKKGLSFILLCHFHCLLYAKAEFNGVCDLVNRLGVFFISYYTLHHDNLKYSIRNGECEHWIHKIRKSKYSLNGKNNYVFFLERAKLENMQQWPN